MITLLSIFWLYIDIIIECTEPSSALIFLRLTEADVYLDNIKIFGYWENEKFSKNPRDNTLYGTQNMIYINTDFNLNNPGLNYTISLTNMEFYDLLTPVFIIGHNVIMNNIIIDHCSSTQGLWNLGLIHLQSLYSFNMNNIKISNSLGFNLIAVLNSIYNFIAPDALNYLTNGEFTNNTILSGAIALFVSGRDAEIVNNLYFKDNTFYIETPAVSNFAPYMILLYQLFQASLKNITIFGNYQTTGVLGLKTLYNI